MMTLAEFVDAFESEVGEQVATLAEAPEINRWLNRGLNRLSVKRPRVATISWAAGDITVTLPDDFLVSDKIRALPDSCLPPHDIFGGQLEFLDLNGAPASGSARLRYFGAWPRITGAQPSLLTSAGDDAILSFALYCFFKKLASSRSDYRRYSTVTGQNGVDINELDALSERHLSDFKETQEEIVETAESATFYGV